MEDLAQYLRETAVKLIEEAKRINPNCQTSGARFHFSWEANVLNVILSFPPEVELPERELGLKELEDMVHDHLEVIFAPYFK